MQLLIQRGFSLWIWITSFILSWKLVGARYQIRKQSIEHKVRQCSEFQMWCYYYCPYGVMRNLDAIIRVSNYVRPNPGLQRARSLRSAASDKLIMPILLAEWEFMRPSQRCKMAEGSSSSCTPRERAVSLLRVVQNLPEESMFRSTTLTSEKSFCHMCRKRKTMGAE